MRERGQTRPGKGWTGISREGEQSWALVQVVPALGEWLGWAGQCSRAEKPQSPATPSSGTQRSQRGSFEYEGQRAERRQRPSLPQVPNLEEQVAAVVAWEPGAPSQTPGLPSASAALGCPPGLYVSPSGCSLSEEVGRMVTQRSMEGSSHFSEADDNNTTR